MLSELQPEYAVSYFSKKDYAGGAGYYLHETDNSNTAYSAIELLSMGATTKTVNELKEIGHMEVYEQPLT